MFEYFDHTADLGIRIFAEDWPELVAEGVRALTSAMVEFPDRIESRDSRVIRVEGTDRTFLFFDALNEALYLFESERWLTASSRWTCSDDVLQGELTGERYDSERHCPGHEVKAITYHGLTVEPPPPHWMASVIVDI